MEVRTTGVPVIGERELRRAADILRRYKQGKQNLERRIIADEDWWKLRQWRQFSDKGNPNDDRPASGWLFNVIMGKHADAVAAYPGPVIRPREPDDRQEAQMLSSIIPCILEQNDFEEVYSDTCWQKMKQGTGVWGVYWDQEKLGGLGDISIRPVNVLNLFWEPGVTDIQRSQNVFYLELEDNETLLAAYPQLAGKLGGSSAVLSRYRTDDAVDLSEKTLVVDWYYKKRVGGKTVLHYCKYVGETVLYATENDTFMPSVTREARDPETGETVLVQTPVRAPACERGLYDDGDYPFIFDRLFPIEGSICGYGYIDIGKGAQEQIDRMDQAIVKNTIMAATPRWFRRSDGSVNEQEYADWTKPFVHVDGNLGQDSLQQVQVNMLPGICVQVLNNKIEELKWTTGNTDVTNGQVSSGVTAASAIAALQEASGRSSRASTQSAYRAYARLIRMVIERIRQFYDLPRRFRIAGLSGAEEFVSYCNARLKAQRMGPEALMRTPVFDVTVTAQKHTAYTKLAQNELALQFFQLGFFRPEMEQQALACLDMMEFDGKQQILQKIRSGADAAAWQRMALTLAGRCPEGALWRYFRENGQGAVLDRMASARAMGRGRLSPEAVRSLYGGTVAMSASRLDKVKTCHFGYFMEYGLRARERKTAKFEAPEIGTFLHYLLENVLRALENGEGIGRAQPERLRALVAQYTEQYIAAVIDSYGDKSARFRYLFSRLRETACTIVENAVEEMQHSDFRPVAFELGFGGRDGQLPAITVTEGDTTLSVTGKVDRVDGWLKAGRLYLRVMDYKTGKKSFDLADVRYGLGIQMLLYLFALQRSGGMYFGRPVEPAGVLYLPARDVILRADRAIPPEKLQASLRRELRRSGMVLAEPDVLAAMEHEALESPCFLPMGISRDGTISGSLASAVQLGKLGRYVDELLHRVAHEIGTGSIDADPCVRGPQESACDRCAFASACWFDERRDKPRYLQKTTPEEFWALVDREVSHG